jgi:heme-degrading monooxygenase HmoA
LLKTEIFPGILARHIAGFRRIELLRTSVGGEVEFATVMWFDSMDAVKAFAGA